jgi:hypothetical protein
VGDGDAEDDADRGRFDNRTEGLVEVNARLLRKAADYPPSLVPSKAAIGVKLVLENPLP